MKDKKKSTKYISIPPDMKLDSWGLDVERKYLIDDMKFFDYTEPLNRDYKTSISPDTYKEMLRMAKEYETHMLPKDQYIQKDQSSKYKATWNWDGMSHLNSEYERKKKERDDLIFDQQKKLDQLKKIILAAFRGRFDIPVEDVAKDYETLLDHYDDLARFKPLSDTAIKKLNDFYHKYK